MVKPMKQYTTVRAKSSKNLKINAAKKSSKTETVGQFKSRIAKLSKEELLEEAEDLLADETL